ncbi:MAG: RNA polymerase sigma-54 factor [Candidatus Cloacimonadota bacterium]|nr:MAG: RNA polymerase sigma-54 factor [Candidatus Cloacimonadota bacterium]
MNKLKQTLLYKQTQNLLLKPKMLQSLEMLALPLLELETQLKQELETNPMLELAEVKEDEEQNEEIENDAVEQVTENEDDEELRRTLKETEELSEILDSWNEQYEEFSHKIRPEELPNYEQIIKAEEDNMKEFYFAVEKLGLSQNEEEFAKDLVDGINDYGFLSEDFDFDKTAEQYHLTPERAEEIHQMVMHLEPKGITARNIKECLLAQIDEEKFNPNIKKIIQNDFEDLIHKRYKKLAAKYEVTLNTMLSWKNQIAKLDPKPGLRLQKSQTNYIAPDVIIKKVGNDYEVISNDYYIPRIRLSRKYKKILQKVKTDKEAISYVRDKVNSAKFLIKSIYLRGRTLERVTKAIIRNQVEFFYENSGVLKPLTYSVIAEELHVNESTISRVVRNKYADTPFGVMCLKDFFTSTAGKDDNYNSISRQNVEKIMRRMIESEDKKNPLSDQDIADKLKEQGINVSRRVVAKYRKAMGILNSHLRKKE